MSGFCIVLTLLSCVKKYKEEIPTSRVEPFPRNLRIRKELRKGIVLGRNSNSNRNVACKALHSESLSAVRGYLKSCDGWLQPQVHKANKTPLWRFGRFCLCLLHHHSNGMLGDVRGIPKSEMEKREVCVMPQAHDKKPFPRHSLWEIAVASLTESNGPLDWWETLVQSSKHFCKPQSEHMIFTVSSHMFAAMQSIKNAIHWAHYISM